MTERPDPKTLEDLQKDKLMLEIEKLRQDMLIQNERLVHDIRKENRQLWVGFIGGGAAFLAAAAAFGKLFFGS